MKILIYQVHEALSLAALDEDRLTDYQRVSPDLEENTGQVILGTITDIVPALNACFVDIGLPKNAFLSLDKDRLSDYKNGQEIPVQIKRKEDGDKGVKVTDTFTISGRYLVLSHKNLVIGVSNKITDQDERMRLKIASRTFKGAGTVGYIFRTESQGIDPLELQNEASVLYDVYQKLLARIPYSRPGTVLYSPGSAVIQFLSQYRKDTIESIQIETSIPLETREDLLKEIDMRLPHLTDLVTIRQPLDGFSLAEVYKIPSAVSEALNKRVFLESGGYLFIEETEALSVIDVNSSHAIEGNVKEAAVLRVNLEATKEIARQLRLRNLSGIIIIDYINMGLDSSRRKVKEALKAACYADPHKVTIQGFTKLGLMELTRETRGTKLKDMLQ